MTPSTKSRSFVFWILAITLTLASVVYQRMTGPTHPVRGKVTVGENILNYKLLRSQVTTADAEIEFTVPDRAVTGEMTWRRYKSDDDWMVVELERRDDNLVAVIPRQPSAGKVVYMIDIIDGEGNRYSLQEKPVIIRFKGEVPAWILVPHIIFMFSAMLVSTRAGIEAIAKGERAYRLAVWTTVFLFLGGIILGPLVQKYAFGAYWTGWPFGHDLTDNKTAIAMLFWILALWRGKNRDSGRGWIIAASVVQLLVYLIPHSALGSELDYTKTDGSH